MYQEKVNVVNEINDFCENLNIPLSYAEKDYIASRILRKLDGERLLSFNEFIDLLDHNAQLEQYSDLNFDDEITSIEEVGEMELVDFDVSGNHLFYANDILTHNSSTNETKNVDNSNVSDSIGTVMTADFMLFLLQDEQMKEKKEIVCKVTKNRFAGHTDTWLMNIDYEHMRFNDMLVQGTPGDVPIQIEELSGNTSESINSDFGIVTLEKQQHAEAYAKQEIKDIVADDLNKLNHSKQKTNPFSNDIDMLHEVLGI
jgi:hypothetical protein